MPASGRRGAGTMRTRMRSWAVVVDRDDGGALKKKTPSIAVMEGAEASRTGELRWRAFHARKLPTGDAVESRAKEEARAMHEWDHTRRGASVKRSAAAHATAHRA